MKIKMNVYLNGLAEDIKRTIIVNDDLEIATFCEYLILAMNGNCKHLYQLVVNETFSYLGPGCDIMDFDYEEMIDLHKLEYLGLRVGDDLMLNYDFLNDWEFMIEVTSIEKGYSGKPFEVVDGKGYGILENCGGISPLCYLINSKNKKSPLQMTFLEILQEDAEDFESFDINNFNIDEINKKIDTYLSSTYDLVRPKNYILNISLEGYGKEIKRKMAIDSNVKLNTFCRCVIASMQGDLSHPYTIKINKEYLEEAIIKKYDMNYLKLQEKQKFKIIYDFGDNWVFNITVSKINEEYGRKKRVEVLSGKGYGIVDDCGGVWGLSSIFNGTSEYFDAVDINDFDLDAINNEIDLMV